MWYICTHNLAKKSSKRYIIKKQMTANYIHNNWEALSISSSGGARRQGRRACRSCRDRRGSCSAVVAAIAPVLIIVTPAIARENVVSGAKVFPCRGGGW
jgi:hypothetical protein